MHITTRRTFIRQAACAALGTTGLLNTVFDLRKLSAATVPAGDYKALVCLFLYGGNDANNMIVPRDATGLTLLYPPNNAPADYRPIHIDLGQ